tara:strand:- start:6736 stop:7791 length:1056 start_codon:yes stop_codon:yes gene_type:complete
MNLKILHITLDNRYGGIYRYIEKWSKSDYKNKINSEHYTFKYKNFNKHLNLINANTSNLRSKSGFLFIIDTFLNISIYLKNSKNKDIIILHSSYLLPVGLILILLKNKVYFLAHDFNNLKIFKLIFKVFLRKRLLFVAPWLRESFIKKKNSSIINHEKSIYLPIIKKSIIKKINFVKKQNRFNLIYVGSLSPVKGLSDLIKLVNMSSFNIQLDVIGEVNPRYISKMPILKSPNKINFLGSIYNKIDKLNYINNSNFAIIPSRSEAFPFVYQEFLNTGKIPLCSDIVVFKELSEKKNHIFSSKDFQSFYKCINWASNLCEEEYLKYIKDLSKNFNLFSKKYKNLTQLSLNLK